jgi:hypothetical protein
MLQHSNFGASKIDELFQLLHVSAASDSDGRSGTLHKSCDHSLGYFVHAQGIGARVSRSGTPCATALNPAAPVMN